MSTIIMIKGTALPMTTMPDTTTDRPAIIMFTCHLPASTGRSRLGPR